MPRFLPFTRRWFDETFVEPTPPQRDGWESIAAGRDTLIVAPTGSGKTLAAFLWAIDALVRRAAEGTLAGETSVVYVSPLRALANDIRVNLLEPLEAIGGLAAEEGIELPEIRVAVRHGDTSASDRDRMLREPPHILVTTPESLFIMLTAERSRGFVRTARTVIVDEIHAVAGGKRGAHLALSLERLDLLAGRPLQRIGLSATQRPIEEIARLLVGAGRLGPDGAPRCAIVDEGHRDMWRLLADEWATASTFVQNDELDTRRARELLDQFGLAEAGDRPVKTYSGGMQRRLDIARGGPETQRQQREVLNRLDELIKKLESGSGNRLKIFIQRCVDDKFKQAHHELARQVIAGKWMRRPLRQHFLCLTHFTDRFKESRP